MRQLAAAGVELLSRRGSALVLRSPLSTPAATASHFGRVALGARRGCCSPRSLLCRRSSELSSLYSIVPLPSWSISSNSASESSREGGVSKRRASARRNSCLLILPSPFSSHRRKRVITRVSLLPRASRNCCLKVAPDLPSKVRKGSAPNTPDISRNSFPPRRRVAVSETTST